MKTIKPFQSKVSESFEKHLIWTRASLFIDICIDLANSFKDYVFIYFYKAKSYSLNDYLGVVFVDFYSFLLAPPDRVYNLSHSNCEGEVKMRCKTEIKYNTKFIIDMISVSNLTISKQILQ